MAPVASSKRSAQPIAGPAPEVLLGGLPHPSQAEAAQALAAAMADIASAIREHTEQRKPMDEFYAGAGERLDLLCAWLRKWTPRVMFATPLVLMAIGAVTPEAAERLSKALAALGIG
jgi:hypothetical protein